MTIYMYDRETLLRLVKAGAAPPMVPHVTHVPGIRDTQCPCFEYEPGPAVDGTCETDGHYVCSDCKHISPRTLAHRVDPKAAAQVEDDEWLEKRGG